MSEAKLLEDLDDVMERIAARIAQGEIGPAIEQLYEHYHDLMSNPDFVRWERAVKHERVESPSRLMNLLKGAAWTLVTVVMILLPFAILALGAMGVVWLFT